MEDIFQRAIEHCQKADRANAALIEAAKLQEQITKDLKLFNGEDQNYPALFSKEVNYQVKARYQHDCDCGDVLIEKLEIRPGLTNGNSKVFSFSLFLSLLADKVSFSFRIARTDNLNVFYLVQCKDDKEFIIETGRGAYVKFASQADFMETLQFCYEAIDCFNEKLDIKLVEHMHYLCQTPVVRSKRNPLLPADYLSAGMKIELFDNNGPIATAVVAVVNTTLLDFYPGTKTIQVTSYHKYLPQKVYCFVFIPGTSGLKEGWYPATGEYSYNPEGPVYQIKPA